jgi:ACS family hexuronate transporter-like MFS transporter
MAIGIVCVVTFAHALWISNLLTIPIDLFTKADVGRVSGLSGMGGAIGGALANFYTGSVVAKFSYWPVFAAAACAHPLACAIVVIALRAWFGTDPRRAPSLR